MIPFYKEDGVIQRSESCVNGMKRMAEYMEGGSDNKRIKSDMDVCKCDDAVKVRAIQKVLENSNDVDDSNLIIQKVKDILKPMKYSEELEPGTVKTVPFIKAEIIKVLKKLKPVPVLNRRKSSRKHTHAQIVSECVDHHWSPRDLSRKWGCTAEKIRQWVKEAG